MMADDSVIRFVRQPNTKLLFDKKIFFFFFRYGENLRGKYMHDVLQKKECFFFFCFIKIETWMYVKTYRQSKLLYTITGIRVFL